MMYGTTPIRNLVESLNVLLYKGVSRNVEATGEYTNLVCWIKVYRWDFTEGLIEVRSRVGLERIEDV